MAYMSVFCVHVVLRAVLVIDGIMIKENCWKLRVNRLGNLFKIVK